MLARCGEKKQMHTVFMGVDERPNVESHGRRYRDTCTREEEAQMKHVGLEQVS